VGELFATEQDRFYKFLGALRIGVPLGFALAALTVLCAAGAYLAKSTSTPPPKPISTPAFYAMAGGPVILSLVALRCCRLSVQLGLGGRPGGFYGAAI
jgi:hypothetical protein